VEEEDETGEEGEEDGVTMMMVAVKMLMSDVMVVECQCSGHGDDEEGGRDRGPKR
jgi:hypothetical protein